MIAEIKGKISSLGSNLSNRLEDDLTGNVFGTLRYMSFNHGLKKILMQGIYPKYLSYVIENIDEEEWSQFIEFWPYDKEGEIDVLVNFTDTIIGIEVKYLSGLSSDEDVNNNFSDSDEASFSKDDYESENQLSRESRIISRLGNGKKKILIFIADGESCREVYKDVKSRKIIEKDVELAYISWQSIFDGLEELNPGNVYEKVIVSDLKDLLIKKGFESFKDFTITDYVENKWYNFVATKKSSMSFEIKEEVDEELYYEFS
ncbi:hypothetical protein [Clostridium sp.]|uniref:hypothetical protein n=1 Tax=Clostridium sp. TaxID=1506 RepID=UPI00284AD30D|nr:hypothetical protein [Clostridium sp.]MDR3597710.1 hypothetical protein [Clostridium sp.]